MSKGQAWATVIAVMVITLLIFLVGFTIDTVIHEIRQERAVLCRIEAALHERPPSTPKPEECK